MFHKIFIIFLLTLILSNNIIAKNTWILDKNLSEINFEVPLLLTENIKGNFTEFDGMIFVDKNIPQNNKAIFSVNIKSIQLNYEKYKDLLLSNIFFNEKKYPVAFIDTKKFDLPNKTYSFHINSELKIKHISNIVPIEIELNYLSNDLVNVKAEFEFSRKSYELGKKTWSSSLILQDKIYLTANLFIKKN